MTNYEKQLIELIKHDTHIMAILKAVEKLNLNDAWVSAGLIQNKFWDTLHHITTPFNDIDVIYFNTSDTSLEKRKAIGSKIRSFTTKSTLVSEKSSPYACEKWV